MERSAATHSAKIKRGMCEKKMSCEKKVATQIYAAVRAGKLPPTIFSTSSP